LPEFRIPFSEGKPASFEATKIQSLIFPEIFYKILTVTQIFSLGPIASGGENRLRWINSVTLFDAQKWKGIRIAEIDLKAMLP
jgi:hypothetical protein